MTLANAIISARMTSQAIKVTDFQNVVSGACPTAKIKVERRTKILTIQRKTDFVTVRQKNVEANQFETKS